jgi:flavorubredoxin
MSTCPCLAFRNNYYKALHAAKKQNKQPHQQQKAPQKPKSQQAVTKPLTPQPAASKPPHTPSVIYHGPQKQHQQQSTSQNKSPKRTVFVVYYSTYGHVEKLARQVAKGLERAGVNAKLFQVPETLPQEILEKMGALAKPSDVPVIKAEDLKQADGFLFGY